MSSKLVRDRMTAAWAALVPAVPLVAVANTEPKGMTSPWAALDFTAFSLERDSLGASACWLESGEVFCNLYVDSGTGNQSLIAQAQNIADAWLGWEDSTGEIKIIRISPMDEFPVSTGLWYGATIGLVYDYRYFN